MRTFLMGLFLGFGLTVGGVFALDARSPEGTQKVVNWGTIGEKAGALSPTRLLRN
jgi:hypothetical protein